MKNIYFFIISLFSLIVFQNSIYASSENLSDNIYKTISVALCDSLIKANETNPNFVILDVRRPTEWSPDHLNGSINRNYYDSDIDAQLDALPKNKIFLIHCLSGGRSAGAFAKMKNLNFTEVYEMSGGINAWKSASYPTTSTHSPKLMLVSYVETSEDSNVNGSTDTINITITNRANDTLTFSSVSFNDVHEVTNNFNIQSKLKGAEDYTFSVYHTPSYFADDTTKITIWSNGGQIDINIVFEQGLIQSTQPENLIDLVVFPNPAKNNLFIKNNSLNTINEVSIININGQMVLNETYFSIQEGINISDLQNGVYFIRITSEEQTVSKKFIINR